MHKSKNILLVIFCLYYTIGTGQIKIDSINQVLIKKNEYFTLEREIIHLHTNKTTYITNEEIWFKAYIQDHRTHKPFAITKNLYITLYNDLGEKIAHKLYLVNNGFADGNFTIPKTLSTGDYVLMASTAHQENFTEDQRYYQQIKIKNLSQQPAEKTENEIKKSYDIQVLPEGGNLLEGVLNICGIKVINQKGLGVKKVVSELFEQGSDMPISTFNLNKFGMGKFTFTPLPNKNYYIVSNIDDTRIKTQIPKPQSKGVLLQCSLHPIKPMLIVELKTNEATLSSIKEKQFHILIHQYQKTKGLTASFKENTTAIKLAIPLKDLPFGTNTISLFDHNNNPIAERLIFNDFHDKIIASENIKTTIKEDSIVTSFNIKSKNLLVENASVSVSILPVETISNTNHRSIINSTYLQPFINSYIENPAYYFQNVTKRKKYDLDILLLTQGWSKYNWNNIFRDNIAYTTEHEQGMTLKGAINRIMSEKNNLLITSPENEFTDLLLPENGKPLRNFEYRNLFLKDSTNLQFVVNDKNSKASDARVKANIITFQPIDNNQRAKQLADKAFSAGSVNDIISNIDSINRTRLFKTDEKLEEVLIIGNKRIKRKTASGRILPKVYQQYLDKEVKASLKNLKNYLVTKSFVLKTNRFGQITIWRRLNGNLIPFQLFVNEQPVQNITSLLGIKLDIVDDIFIVEKDIVTPNSIQLYTSQKNYLNNNDKPLDLFLVTNGFQSKKTFYIPKYQSYDNLFFNQYGILGWIPTIKKNKNNEYEFSFLNTLSKEAKIFIEGIDQNGNLISEAKIIQIPSNL
ncbi:hypothetical protein GCM10009430_00680 [Aquimarina litoralis]|uniref:MG2 domain-containing protein n=1 Tax=Aquimarina litoralis TaxID=584605 RepID=A0ABP3TKY7_9FLAO